ncbi:hydroxyacid dehydrogenase [Oceaniglobus indicus]|uniref:hydroxyacid dehydrogenase n=1 Tax=Oceaniglobus indicus TaxID=2047749 RepID=UPI000C18349C|nr:hydroxyacid dehydrogenase [Oceaniglobus indicus]
MADPKPLVLSVPHPRSIDLIFDAPSKDQLFSRYEVLETEADDLADLDDKTLGRARYILGQPPLSDELLARLGNLRCVFNVESNLIDNMPYETLFSRGVHVVTTGAVFAQPVAELGLAMALNLARGILPADQAFREGREVWGGDGNLRARTLEDSDIGIIGFGDLGRALRRVLSGFRARIRVFDPWLPPSMLRDHDVIPATLDEVLETSATIFVVAAITSENRALLDAKALSRMPDGAGLILLSRADIVDFDALMAEVRSGRITAASDVFPEEPLPKQHPVRDLDGFIRSAHRAGALDSAFRKMGEMVLEDMALLDRGLPPQRCKRAERETVNRMRSRPVAIN